MRCAPRRKHVDLSLRVGGGGKQPSDYAKGYATIGDIMKQLAHAYSSPGRTKPANDATASSATTRTTSRSTRIRIPSGGGLRDEAPLYRNDKHDFWALSRYEDVAAGLIDWETLQLGARQRARDHPRAA